MPIDIDGILEDLVTDALTNPDPEARDVKLSSLLNTIVKHSKNSTDADLKIRQLEAKFPELQSKQAFQLQKENLRLKGQSEARQGKIEELETRSRLKQAESVAEAKLKAQIQAGENLAAVKAAQTKRNEALHQLQGMVTSNAIFDPATVATMKNKALEAGASVQQVQSYEQTLTNRSSEAKTEAKTRINKLSEGHGVHDTISQEIDNLVDTTKRNISREQLTLLASRNRNAQKIASLEEMVAKSKPQFGGLYGTKTTPILQELSTLKAAAINALDKTAAEEAFKKASVVAVSGKPGLTGLGKGILGTGLGLLGMLLYKKFTEPDQPTQSGMDPRMMQLMTELQTRQADINLKNTRANKYSKETQGVELDNLLRLLQMSSMSGSAGGVI